MNDSSSALHAQQLVELLEVVSSFSGMSSATHGAVERAAQVLEAEVAALVLDGRVVNSVGFPVGAVPHDDLVQVAAGSRDTLEVPGAGSCFTASAELGGPDQGHLVLARSGDEGFTVPELNLLGGMARMLDLSLRMLRTHDSLRQRQRLMEQLYGIQRAISRRVPLQEVLAAIVRSAQELLGDEIVGLWLIDSNSPDTALLVSSLGLHDDVGKRLWRIPVAEAGAAGQAILTDQLTTVPGYTTAGARLRELTRGELRQSMATPVHENGKIAGSLAVASCGRDRVYSAAEQETLLAFAEHVSLAVTDAKTLNDMHQAFHDSLTGLASRALFLDRLQHSLACAERNGYRIGLLFVDLDRFKMVNDTFGHAAGDLLLMGVAQRLQAGLRNGDMAARFGGDEFAIMLQNVTHTGQATSIAERLIVALREPFPIGRRQVSVNASIGITLCSSVQDPKELMRQADVAMYQAKRNGRGRWEVFERGMDARFEDYQIEADLRRALDQFTHGTVTSPEV